jgi:hypothetical protein
MRTEPSLAVNLGRALGTILGSLLGKALRRALRVRCCTGHRLVFLHNLQGRHDASPRGVYACRRQDCGHVRLGEPGFPTRR